MYRRTFSDGSGITAVGTLSLTPTSGGAVELGLNRLDLKFDDRSRVKIVPEGERLFAIAELGFVGSGVAQLEWQVAEPSTTQGAPVYRRLRIMRQALSGGGRAVLRSPALPTRANGLYIVRLVAVDPTLPSGTADLKYFVVPGKGAGAAPGGQKIALMGPVENSPLTLKTQFSWERVPGASVYQLEIYTLRPTEPLAPATAASIDEQLLIDPDELARRPVAGVAIPADETSVSVKAHSLARLQNGGVFLWRVKAIAGNGAVIGTSPLRRIVVPK
jgi:hypothetical protein